MLHSMGSQRVRHNLVTEQQQHDRYKARFCLPLQKTKWGSCHMDDNKLIRHSLLEFQTLRKLEQSTGSSRDYFYRCSKVAYQLMSEMAESPILYSVWSWQVLGSWPSLSPVFQPSFLVHDASFQKIPFLLRELKWFLSSIFRNPTHTVPCLHMHWH